MKITLISVISIFFLFQSCNNSESNKSTLDSKAETTYIFSDPMHLPEGFIIETLKINDSSRCLTAVMSIPISPIEVWLPFMQIVQDSSQALLHRFSDSFEKREQPCQKRNILEVFPICTSLQMGLLSCCYKVYSCPMDGKSSSFFQTFNYDVTQEKLISAKDFFNANETQALLSWLNTEAKSLNVHVSAMDMIDFNLEKDSICFNLCDARTSSGLRSIRLKRPLSDISPFLSRPLDSKKSFE